MALVVAPVVCADHNTAAISEDQAVDAVRRLPAVEAFMKRVRNPVKFVATAVPTGPAPAWSIQVAEDAGDHLATFDHFTVDAASGKVLASDFGAQVSPTPAAGPSPEAASVPTGGPWAAPEPPRDESRSGDTLVLPGHTRPVPSPDGRLEAWVEGWTTDPQTSATVTTITADEMLARLHFHARLLVGPRDGKGPARTLAKVGPRPNPDNDVYHDLRIVAWAPDSRAILCEYTQGVPFSDVGSLHLMLARLDRSHRIVLSGHLRSLCEARGLALDPEWSWQMDILGYTPDGAIEVWFAETGDEGGATKKGPRRFAVDPGSLSVRALE